MDQMGSLARLSKSYFDLPKWIEDIQEPQIFEDTYMSNNYEINSIIKSSNGGNIYLANSKNIIGKL